jgi:acyl-CoA reductase-like NAD-dependent aldehyde dehydrogenase
VEADAFIVLDDADLDHTVAMAILGRFGNNGQTCIGAKRFIVVESMLDKFLPRFIAAAKELKLGDPLDESVTLGPLASDSALQLILRQINDAMSHGAKVLLGGNRAGTVGAFLEPTVLTGLTPDNPAYKQEFFGPVALILPAKDEAEAIAIANDSPFGLGVRSTPLISRRAPSGSSGWFFFKCSVSQLDVRQANHMIRAPATASGFSRYLLALSQEERKDSASPWP